MKFTKMHGLGNDYLYVYGEVPGNAAELSKAKASIVIKQKEFSPEKVAELLMTYIKAPKDLLQMSNKARKTGINDAAKRLADAVEREIIVHW